MDSFNVNFDKNSRFFPCLDYDDVEHVFVFQNSPLKVIFLFTCRLVSRNMSLRSLPAAVSSSMRDSTYLSSADKM